MTALDALPRRLSTTLLTVRGGEKKNESPPYACWEFLELCVRSPSEVTTVCFAILN